MKSPVVIASLMISIALITSAALPGAAIKVIRTQPGSGSTSPGREAAVNLPASLSVKLDIPDQIKTNNENFNKQQVFHPHLEAHLINTGRRWL